jgi:HPt (histidine-containing phosphotransfer) domain-containing protein
MSLPRPIVSTEAGPETESSPSPGPGGKSAVRVFDPDAALRSCCDDPEMLREMIACFHCEVDSLFPQIREALQKGDLVAVGRLGHRMKGTVVYLGAEAAKEAALRVEHFERHPGTVAEAEQAVNGLEQHCEILKSALVLDRTNT